jgi:hypothetical protein
MAIQQCKHSILKQFFEVRKRGRERGRGRGRAKEGKKT